MTAPHAIPPRTRRGVAVVLAAVVALLAGDLAGGGSAGAMVADREPWPRWEAVATGQFRSHVVVGGEYVWTNGIMQARGANTDGLHREDYWALVAAGGTFPYDERQTLERHLTWGAFGVDRWATDGDQELPLDDEAWPEFTGEIAELRLQADEDELFVRFLWNSLPGDEAQIATLAFTDARSPATSTAWPHEAGVTSPWGVALTTWGTGGSVTVAGGAPVDLAEVGGAVRVVDHAVEVRLPSALLPAGPWQLRGGGGLADPDDPSRYWAVPAGSATASRPGSGATGVPGSPVWSLLFATDDPWVFSARREGDLLADGDVSPAMVVVDPDLLLSGGDQRAVPRSGWVGRQYASAFDFGDGIDKGPPGEPPPPFVLPPEVPLDDVGRSYSYTGRLQPYGMYVPAAYHRRPPETRWPLVVYLHGLNNFYYEPHGTLFNLPAMLEERGYLFATLLGRGDLSYRGAGELDVREALADIAEHYDVDPDRIHVMGHSMGSIGSHNLATRNPDLFASGAPAQITASDDLVANLEHVPWLMVGGSGDFLDPGSSSEVGTYGLMSGLGFDVTFLDYLAKTHESTSISDTLPAMFDLFDRTRRVASPGRFTYRRLPGDDHPEIGVVHDRAWQASGLTFADPAGPQQIAVTSFAIPHAPLDPRAATRTEAVVDEGGPSGRTVARKHVTVPAPGPPVTVRNAASVVLDNVATVALDVPGLRLRVAPGMQLEIVTTDPVAVTLAAVGPEVPGLLLDGGPVAARPAPGARGLVVDVPRGEHVLAVAAAGAGDAAVPLPVTGGGAVVAAGVLLALAARRRTCWALPRVPTEHDERSARVR